MTPASPTLFSLSTRKDALCWLSQMDPKGGVQTGFQQRRLIEATVLMVKAPFNRFLERVQIANPKMVPCFKTDIHISFRVVSAAIRLRISGQSQAAGFGSGRGSVSSNFVDLDVPLEKLSGVSPLLLPFLEAGGFAVQAMENQTSGFLKLDWKRSKGIQLNSESIEEGVAPNVSWYKIEHATEWLSEIRAGSMERAFASSGNPPKRKIRF